MKVFMLMTFLAIAMSAVSTNAIATDYWVSTGEEIGFGLSNGELVNVYYSPQEQGTREFTSWHSTIAAWNKVAGMSFYYRDTSIPNDPWHWWRNAAVGYIWPKVEQSLYSGSTTIEYKFSFRQVTTPVMFVHVEIE